MEADKYTSYSLSKDPDEGEQRSTGPEVKPVEVNVYRDPELVALDNLRMFLPMFPGSKTKHFFTPNEQEVFEKRMYIADVWPILLILQDFQSHLNETGNQMGARQAFIGKKIEDNKVFNVKVLHNLALLGSEIQHFETNLQTVTAVEQGVKSIQEKLRNVIKKTFNLLDLIPEEERVDIPCPIEVSVPYLRKDQYTSINLYEKTPHYLAISLEDKDHYRFVEDKWLQDILPNWDALCQPDEKTYFWREGIPFRLRGCVWKKLIPNKLNLTEELYMELQVKAHQANSTIIDWSLPPEQVVAPPSVENISPKVPRIITINSPKFSERNTRELIRRDLPRTFPELKLFKNPESEPYNQILKVLETAAYFQPEIGYVQGMSYVAATLLLFMNHYDTFVCFTNLMNTPFMRSVCRVELADLAKHSQLFQIIFAQYAPELYEHFNNLNITTEHFLLDWWLTLFTKAVSLPLACHIWDCFLIEGEIFVHYVAVGALKLSDTQLLKANFEECLDLVTVQIPKSLTDVALFSIIKEFSITPKIQAIMEEMHDVI